MERSRPVCSAYAVMTASPNQDNHSGQPLQQPPGREPLQDVSSNIAVKRSLSSYQLCALKKRKINPSDHSPGQPSQNEAVVPLQDLAESGAESHAANIESPSQQQVPWNGLIPPPEREPKLQKRDITEDVAAIIVFDLETAGPGAQAEITQISATSWDGTADYNRYVLPNGDIFSTVTEITGIKTAVFENGRRGLIFRGERVESFPVKDALTEFMKWIRSLTDTIKQPILCAHNARAFDMRVIITEIQRCGLQDELEKTIGGFMDSLLAFKIFKPGLSSYKQEKLYQHFVGGTYDAHNALVDTKALQKLIHKSQIPFQTLSQNVYTTHSALENVSFHARKQFRLETLKPYLSGPVSKDILNKIAASGLDYDNLRLVYDNGGPNGLRDMLTEQFQGRPRVTNRKGILDTLVKHFN